MKKLVSLLLCVMLLLPVAALAEDGWFAAAQFSDEEWLLIQLLGMDEDYGPYEFKAPEGATHLTLTVLELVDSQWVEFSSHQYPLDIPEMPVSVTLTAAQQEDGTWDAKIHQQRIGSDLPDGRLFIDGYDLPDNIWFRLMLRGHDDPTGSNIFNEAEFDLSGLHRFRRTFLNPEQRGFIQQKATASLNEPVLLELYVCTRSYHYQVPDLAAFNDPTAFADFDYTFAVTATFTAKEE